MGKWFGQASEIEELRAENSRLKEQVATLEARLRAAYADAGVTALAGSTAPAPEAAAPHSGSCYLFPGLVAGAERGGNPDGRRGQGDLRRQELQGPHRPRPQDGEGGNRRRPHRVGT